MSTVLNNEGSYYYVMPKINEPLEVPPAPRVVIDKPRVQTKQADPTGKNIETKSKDGYSIY